MVSGIPGAVHTDDPPVPVLELGKGQTKEGRLWVYLRAQTGLPPAAFYDYTPTRNKAGSLLITSNQPFSAWDSVFPDDMMAVAAVDRLIHHAHIVELSGESYRKRAHTRNRKEVSTTTNA